MKLAIGERIKRLRGNALMTQARPFSTQSSMKHDSSGEGIVRLTELGG